MNNNHSIRLIPGIFEWDVRKLEENSIRTTLRLLNATSRMAHRQSLSIRTGISQTDLLRYANAADLMRIPHVGPTTVELLRRVDIPSVGELSTRNPDNLYQLLKSVVGENTIPSLGLIKLWIDGAKDLERVIHYRNGANRGSRSSD